MFKLGTFRGQDGCVFVAFVRGNKAVAIASCHKHYAASPFAKAGTLSATDSIAGLLDDWQRNFSVLQAMSDFAQSEGLEGGRLKGGVFALASLRTLPPIPRPPKILHSAANYPEHVKEMGAYTQSQGSVEKSKVFTGDKTRARPYLFLKASSALTGAYDDIVMPHGEHQIDWEAEVAAVIGRPGKGIKAEHAIDHVAGFMTANDVTCRDGLFREDRENFRTDWLSSKSYDTFAPMGPYFVPREFVPNHRDMHIRLSVNGEVKQDGSTAGMIFSLEEQMEFASAMMTLESGDVFVTGTIGGVGQSTGTYLKVGDVVETEVVGLGMQRNNVVAARP